MKKRILIVDDDWFYLKLLEFRLGKRGFDVVTARSEREFWDQAFERTPDVLLIDIFLKNKIGSNTYHSMIDFGFSSTIPVIFMSAFVDREATRSLQRGMPVMVYSKSDRFEELVKAIHHALDQRKREGTKQNPVGAHSFVGS